jgi:hypothetical protein
VDEAFQGSDHQRYVVQRSYSNQKNRCVGSNSSTFSIRLAAGAHVTAFDMGTDPVYSITTEAYNAAAPAVIQFTVEGLPPGWIASFSPASLVTAGTPVDLTVKTSGVGAAIVSSFPIITIVASSTAGPATNARIALLLPVTNLLNGNFATSIDHWTLISGNAFSEQGVALVGTTAVAQSSLQQSFVINTDFFYFDMGVLCCTNPQDLTSCANSATSSTIVVATLSFQVEGIPTYTKTLPCSFGFSPRRFTLGVSNVVGRLATVTLTTTSDSGVAAVGLYYQMGNVNKL